ncbi:hypothetical protein M8J77_006380 [Diaphorina citri]|nr:hypothetical protein M8J77_006380 [Diaphorina citri]
MSVFKNIDFHRPGPRPRPTALPVRECTVVSSIVFCSCLLDRAREFHLDRAPISALTVRSLRNAVLCQSCEASGLENSASSFQTTPFRGDLV